jgi:hypothetical protein
MEMHMEGVVESFGNVDVLVVPSVGLEQVDLAGKTDGIEYTAKKKASSLRETLREVASSLSEDMTSLGEKLAPNNIELKFELSYSQKLGMWAFEGKGTGSVSVVLKWNR